MMQDNIQAQAQYYANVPLLDRRYIASVHVEGVEDEVFWNRMLQEVKPGEYNFVPYSRSAGGNDTTGCGQCLRYVGYLSPLFFVCIDSDIRNLVGNCLYSANDYVSQTYAYSWENHVCHVPELQQRFASVCPVPRHAFDFDAFLTQYSEVLYRGLLLLIHEERKGNKVFFKEFIAVLPKQSVTDSLVDNGEPYCAEVSTKIQELYERLGKPDLTQEVDLCNRVGITVENAYLYIRGHNIYDLIASIGRSICKIQGVSFERDVLKSEFPTQGYPEIDKARNDLIQILTVANDTRVTPHN